MLWVTSVGWSSHKQHLKKSFFLHFDLPRRKSSTSYLVTQLPKSWPAVLADYSRKPYFWCSSAKICLLSSCSNGRMTELSEEKKPNTDLFGSIARHHKGRHEKDKERTDLKVRWPNKSAPCRSHVHTHTNTRVYYTNHRLISLPLQVVTVPLCGEPVWPLCVCQVSKTSLAPHHLWPHGGFHIVNKINIALYEHPWTQARVAGRSLQKQSFDFTSRHLCSQLLSAVK